MLPGRKKFNPEIILDIINTHPKIIYGDKVCDNFYYVPPKEFIDKDKKRTIEPSDKGEIVYPTDNFFYNTTWLLYKNFAASIKGKEKLLLGLEEGYQSAISVHLANMAVRNGQVAEWKDEYSI